VPRVFFAVWPDDASADALHRIAGEAHRTCGGRVMRRDTLHLTLAFLGDLSSDRVSEAVRVADAIVAPQFDLVLDRLGYWRHNRILWAGGVPPPLTFVADTLSERLRAAGFALDARPFVAHMTLLRDTHCDETPMLARPVGWPVREFVLAESRCARYDIIGRWPLAQPG
jgi:2'-5' RNA ligase